MWKNICFLTLYAYFVCYFAMAQTMPSSDELSNASSCFERWFGQNVTNNMDLFPGSLTTGTYLFFKIQKNGSAKLLRKKAITPNLLF